MFIKNIKRAAAASLLACCALLASCGSQPEEELFISARSELIMATGTSTGTYYTFGSALAQTLQNHTEFDYQVQSTGGSQANVMLIAAGDADIALAQNDVIDYAYSGTELFDGEHIPGFSAVGACYTEVCQIVARGGVDSIDELEGLTVSVGDSGSGVEFNARQILSVYGLSFESITPVNMNFADSAKALANGDIDAFFCTAGVPTTSISDLANSQRINLLEIDDENAQALMAAHPFFTRCAIPAETYDGVDYDVQTVAVKAALIVSSSLSEDAVYEITKALFEFAPEIAAAHPKGAELSEAFAVSGITVPFHPGAVKYYREKGLM